jgi:hypothetical protein
MHFIFDLIEQSKVNNSISFITRLLSIIKNGWETDKESEAGQN